jgi:hypothetical protein
MVQGEVTGSQTLPYCLLSRFSWGTTAKFSGAVVIIHTDCDGNATTTTEDGGYTKTTRKIKFFQYVMVLPKF